MADIMVDCVGQNCPVPLVETRKAIRKATPGDVIQVTGTHPSSKREIPMAARAMGLVVLDVTEDGERWTIRIQR